MEQVKRTNRDIIRFSNAATLWQQQPAVKKESAMSGFKYAISRVLKSTTKAIEDYNERLTELNIEAATTDEKGNILLDARGATIFNKEESKKRNLEIRKLMDTEVEVGVYFSKKFPDDLTAFQIDAFEGFVIPEMTEPVDTSA